MKKNFCIIAIFFIVLNNNFLFADDDDVPYLSDADIAAIEMVLSDDIPENLQEHAKEAVVEVNANNAQDEISRLNTSQTIYHLLILDRINCAPNSDITDLDGIRILYKYRHGSDGYLIAIYTSPLEGPIFPQLPDRSRILVELMTVRINTIKEYINSSAFRRFVTSQRILSQIQEAL